MAHCRKQTQKCILDKLQSAVHQLCSNSVESDKNFLVWRNEWDTQNSPGQRESKPQSNCDAHYSGGLQINFEHQRIFNLHVNPSTQTFLHFAFIRMRPPGQRLNRWPLLQQLNAVATKLPQGVSRQLCHHQVLCFRAEVFSINTKKKKKDKRRQRKTESMSKRSLHTYSAKIAIMKAVIA